MKKYIWVLVIIAVISLLALMNGQTVVNGRKDGFNCVVAVSTATTVQAVGGACASPGTRPIYITDIEFGSSAAGGTAADSFPTLKQGSGTTCGTNTLVIWQSMITANGEVNPNFTTPIKVTKGNDICWIMTTAGSKTLQIHGFYGADNE